MAAKHRPALEPAKLETQLADHGAVDLLEFPPLYELGHEAVLHGDEFVGPAVEFIFLYASVNVESLGAPVDAEREHLPQGSQDAGIAHLSRDRVMDPEDHAVLEMVPGLEGAEFRGRRVEVFPIVKRNVRYLRHSSLLSLMQRGRLQAKSTRSAENHEACCRHAVGRL